MSFIPTLDTDSPQRPRIPRPLDPAEIRVLGSLMEKQLSTPEYYPLTLNALVAACNQKSNREPVMELSESDVETALDRLQEEKLVWRVIGGRAVRFDQNLDKVWHLKPSEKAILTLLFLRGPQTAGEIRGRSDRLHKFESINEIEETLREMAAHSEPLVRDLGRRPGQKESRWTHLAGGEPAVEEQPRPEARGPRPDEQVSARIARLEQQVAALDGQIRELLKRLGG